ncbi:MAG: flagellar biosynthesis protein FlhB [Selenomonadaceae bacterium]|nr:flagellar biosynthesis protein FlhB [Selenomonadaceae bacterium]
MTCTQIFLRQFGSSHLSDFEKILEKNLHEDKNFFSEENNFTEKISPSLPQNFFDLQRFAEGDKTEEPTAKRRGDARKKGQVAKSQELNTAFVLLAGFLVIKVFWEYMYVNVAEYSAYIFGHLHENGTSVDDVMKIFLDIVNVMVSTAFPVMIGVLIFALAVNIYQVGFMISTERLEPKLSNLNPISGFGRLFSKRALVELVKSLFKIIVIGFFLYLYLKDEIPFMPYFIYYDLEYSLAEIADKIFVMAFQVIAVIMVLAAADYAYQKWQMTQDLMMTKQEVKDEYKQMEGDPQIKGKIKQKQRQMAMARMMQEVPKADVIVTNPTHLAIALMYKKGMVAPQILAKGQDLVAEKIKAKAREHRIPIVENKPLARALYETVEVGDIVPHNLYQAVAEVLAYVYRLKNKKVPPPRKTN